MKVISINNKLMIELSDLQEAGHFIEMTKLYQRQMALSEKKIPEKINKKLSFLRANLFSELLKNKKQIVYAVG